MLKSRNIVLLTGRTDGIHKCSSPYLLSFVSSSVGDAWLIDLGELDGRVGRWEIGGTVEENLLNIQQLLYPFSNLCKCWIY